MEEDPSKNPPEGSKPLTDLYVSDITDTKIHPDVKGADDMSVKVSPDLEGLTSEVSNKAILGAINDYGLGIMHGLSEDARVRDLPAEATAAVEYLDMAVKRSAVDNDPDAVMGLSCELALRDGPMYEEALDYPPGDEIDQERYIRILENLAGAIELISTWQMLYDQQKNIPDTLYNRLSGAIDDMQCGELAELIAKRVSG